MYCQLRRMELVKAYAIFFIVQARTYPDLLKSPHDEALMEYYCQSSLVYIDVRSCPYLWVTMLSPSLLRAVCLLNSILKPHAVLSGMS